MKIAILVVGLFVSFAPLAQAKCLLGVTIDGAITAATFDYLKRAEKQAEALNCSGILLRMNTPGGNLQSTRMIVESILASNKPHLCLISPVGGHAGSAGAIILQACHLSGGLTATNLGAATPIMGTGQEMSSDLRNKMVNDTVAWLEGVTRLRGRNLDFSKKIITEAKSVSIDEAVRIKAMEIVAQDEQDFLKQALGRTVKFSDNTTSTIEFSGVTEFQVDLRTRVLNFLSDPELSYLLFMGSIALIYAEITTPGLLVPGILGAIGLVVSMISFHKLDVEWGGVALLLLGIALLIAEIFVTSFGILGVGGVIALVLGSLFMFTPEQAGFQLPVGLIGSVVGVIAVIFLGMSIIMIRSLRFKSKDQDGVLRESEARVVNEHQVEINGELWNYESSQKLSPGDAVTVLDRHGLTLKVQKK